MNKEFPPCTKCSEGVIQQTLMSYEEKVFVVRGCNRCNNGWWEEAKDE